MVGPPVVDWTSGAPGVVSDKQGSWIPKEIGIVSIQTGHARRRMSPFALIAALALGLGLAGTALAVDPVYATVDGYAVGSADNNHQDTWGENCTKIAENGNLESYVLPDLGAGLAYDLVIVKAGSEVSTDGHANTLFDNPAAGETVWADTNGNGAFDFGGQDGDKTISHIIVCLGEVEETPAETPVETPAETPVETPAETPEGSVAGGTIAPTPEGSVQGSTGTPAPSQPDTAMGAPGGPSAIPTIGFALILLAALGTLAWANVRSARNRA
jgi:hypothetical protein